MGRFGEIRELRELEYGCYMVKYFDLRSTKEAVKASQKKPPFGVPWLIQYYTCEDDGVERPEKPKEPLRKPPQTKCFNGQQLPQEGWTPHFPFNQGPQMRPPQRPPKPMMERRNENNWLVPPQRPPYNPVKPIPPPPPPRPMFKQTNHPIQMQRSNPNYYQQRMPPYLPPQQPYQPKPPENFQYPIQFVRRYDGRPLPNFNPPAVEGQMNHQNQTPQTINQQPASKEELNHDAEENTTKSIVDIDEGPVLDESTIYTNRPYQASINVQPVLTGSIAVDESYGYLTATRGVLLDGQTLNRLRNLK